LILSSHKANDLKIVSIENRDNILKASTQTVKDGSRFRIAVSPARHELRTGVTETTLFSKKFIESKIDIVLSNIDRAFAAASGYL
jgi:hypothetical protein